MKWHKKPLGNEEVSPHLERIFGRSDSRGILISASGFTDPAVTICKEALRDKVIVFCTLEEIVIVLERRLDLCLFLRTKINAAIIDKNPLHEPIAAGQM
jgi:hypothetical protein